MNTTTLTRTALVPMVAMAGIALAAIGFAPHSAAAVVDVERIADIGTRVSVAPSPKGGNVEFEWKVEEGEEASDKANVQNQNRNKLRYVEYFTGGGHSKGDEHEMEYDLVSVK